MLERGQLVERGFRYRGCGAPTRRHLPTQASIQSAVIQLVRTLVEDLQRDGLLSLPEALRDEVGP